MGCSVLGRSVACVLVLVCSVLLPCLPGGVLVVIVLWLVCGTTFPCRAVLLYCYTVFTVRGWLFLLLYQLQRFVFTQRSAFFELSYPRTHILHVHNAVIAGLNHLLMNVDGFHDTQMEECDNHLLLFQCEFYCGRN